MTTALSVDPDDLREGLEQLAQYGLPVAGMTRYFDVGSSGFLQYVDTELLDGLVAHGGATCKLIEGPYGSGKTHILQLLEDTALMRGMAVARTELSADQHLEDWHLIAKFILQNIEFQSDRGVVRSLPRVLEAIAAFPASTSDRLREPGMSHQGFAKAMATYLDQCRQQGRGDDVLQRFLEGEKVSATTLKSRHVAGVKHPLSRRNAEHVVKTVLAGLHRLGVPGTLLLFDETEHTFASPKGTPSKRVRVAANLFRRLIDGSASGSLSATLVGFAVLPGFIENCAEAYPALGQRLGRDAHAQEVGWRSPVLRVDTISQAHDPDAFVEAFVTRVHEAVGQLGASTGAAQQRELLEIGRTAASQQAGSGYRRHVVKHVATHALRYI